MLDANTEIIVPFSSDGNVKKIVVRFPTDEEWERWRKKKKIRQKDLGHGAFDAEPSKPEACDLELIDSIRLDREGLVSVNEAEAFMIVRRLAHCEVPDYPERHGATCRITMRVMQQLTTVHNLRPPSARQLLNYESSRSHVLWTGYGHQEIRINLHARAVLYDQLVESVEGYGGDVPIIHKAEVVNVLVQQLQAEQ